MPTALLTAPNVRAALAAIRGATPLRLSALLDLRLVGARLRQEGLPDTVAGREWALGIVLTEAVEQALGHGEDGYDNRSAASAATELERAMRTDDMDAQAWWMLWLRFLEGQGVAASDIASQSGVTQRTLQRRVQRGCRLLAGALRDGEAALDAQAANERRLGAPLPASNAPDEPKVHESPSTSPPPPLAPLPPERDAYVARPHLEQALTALCHAHRLVTLVGPGGAGKTRLAVHVAATLEAGGAPFVPVTFLSLETVSPKEDILSELCRMLVIEPRHLQGAEGRNETSLQALTRTLAAHGGLLVLDNCEHVLHEVADLSRHLLDHGPTLRILATSRRPLDLGEEQRLPLGPMSLPSEPSEPSGLAGPEEPPEPGQPTYHTSEAVALFLARARSIDPALALDATSGPLITRICRALDGLPLALEIAAAGLEHLSLPMLAETIDEEIPALHHPDPNAPDRRRSLDAAVRWSTDHLDENNRQALLALSVFEGGFTTEAASAVLAPRSPAAVRALQRSLVRRSLLVAPTAASGERYRLLHPVRATLRARLEEAGAPSREDTENAHARYFADWLQDVTPSLQGDRAGESLARLDAASADVHAAFERALSRDPALALRIASSMAGYWLMRGHVQAGRRRLEHALSNAPDAPPELRVPALLGHARLARQASDPTATVRALDEAIDWLRQSDDRRATADALREAGIVREQQRDVTGAAESYRESLALYLAEGEVFGEAAVHNNLGLLAHHEGDFDAASRRFTHSLLLFRGIEARRESGIVLANLANVRGDRGELALAAEDYAEALAIAEDFDDPAGKAAILPSLAWVRLQEGDEAGAGAALADAIPHLFQVEDRRKAGEWLGCAASWLECRGDVASAAVALNAEAVLREVIGGDILPKEQEERRALEARLAARSAPEQRRTWRETGRSLPWQDALVRTLRAIRALEGGPEARGPGKE